MTKEQLEFLTMVELKAMAKEKGIKGYSRLRKAEIINAIVEHEENQNVTNTNDDTTIQILEEFYADCVEFWHYEKERGYKDEETEEELALSDIRNITTNPFSQKGEALNLATKSVWLKQKEKEIKTAKENSNDVILEELKPLFDSCKSYYKKAHVITQGEQKRLRSYDTIVCTIVGQQATITGTYSKTTVRHINEFLAQNGLKRGTKKELEKMYL